MPARFCQLRRSRIGDEAERDAMRACLPHSMISGPESFTMIPEVPRPKRCSHAAYLGIIFVPADAAAWEFNRHMAGPDKNVAAHMEDAGQ
jgi:hypothetical protein